MNWLQRLQNLWKISEYEPRIQGTEPIKEGTIVVQQLIKKPEQKAVFLPRVKIDPIREITQEQS